jgi:hypothetical protein
VARNLPLIFGLVLAGGLLVENGAKVFGATFSGSGDVAGTDTPYTSDQSQGSAPAGAAGAAGVSADEGQARDWIKQGLRLAGIPDTPANVETVLGRAKQESSLNPHAQNNWDSNARKGTPSKGFLQTIDGTFSAYAVPGHHDIWNPVDNTAAAVRYMMARYGHLVGAGAGGY